jgi:hypothetical protein
MPGPQRCAKLLAVMDARPLIVCLAAAAAALSGCGDSAGGAARDRAAAPAATAAVAPPEASRPTAPAGPTLVKLERDGHASLVLAHGGGGFRKAACTLGAGSVQGLQRDLRRLPIDGRARPVPGYEDVPEHSDGVIIARPPVYAVTYRRHFQIFGGRTMPVDGAPIAARLERILTAHEGRCRVTFHRP